PVQVSMKTNIDFDVIVDFQSQALAWIYFGKASPKLRPMGLRGSIEVSNMLHDLSAKDEATKQKALETLEVVAKALALPECVVRGPPEEIGEAPYPPSLSKVWGRTKSMWGKPRPPRPSRWAAVLRAIQWLRSRLSASGPKAAGAAG